MTIFQNNLLTLRGSCVLTFFRMEALVIHESARQRNIGLSSLLFISLTTDLQCSTMRASTLFSEVKKGLMLSCLLFHSILLWSRSNNTLMSFSDTNSVFLEQGRKSNTSMLFMILLLMQDDN